MVPELGEGVVIGLVYFKKEGCSMEVAQLFSIKEKFQVIFVFLDYKISFHL